jgi:hypothetical protein
MANYDDRTNILETLKNVYGEGLKNQFDDAKITYTLFPKSPRRPGGVGYTFGVRYSRSQDGGARAESAPLPQPLTGVKDQGVITPKYNYQSLRITGPAIELAKSATEAFVNSLADSIEDRYQSLLVDLNRQCHGDGFGKVGVLSAAATPDTHAAWTATFSNDLGVKYMKRGMLIDFYDSTGATADATACNLRISTINPTTKVVTFEAAAGSYKAGHPNSTIAAYTETEAEIGVSSIAVKSGSRLPSHATTDTPYELTGLLGIYDNDTLLASFEGIDCGNNPEWNANVLSNSSINRELSLDLMLDACDVTRLRSDATVTRMRMGLGQRRKYANLLTSDVRYSPEVLKGGYKTITFAAGDGSIEMIIDPSQQANRIFFEPDGVIQKYELTPLGWGNLDGSQLHQRSGYDEWDAFLRIYTQLGCEQRNCLTVMSDLTEPDSY